MKLLLPLAGSMLLVVIAFKSTGGYINFTCSAPVGLWRRINAPVSRGAFVYACPRRSKALRQAIKRGYIGVGPCKRRVAGMIKEVVAVPGDTISIIREGIRVNGQRIPESKQRAFDFQGRTLPAHTLKHRILSKNQFLLLNRNKRSFDGRYFGPVDRRAIKAVITPAITLDAACGTR